MSLIDRVLEQECEGENSALYAVVRGLLNETDRKITFGQAVGIARAVRFALAHADEYNTQIAIGTSYLRDLEPLVERTGKAQAHHIKTSLV